MESTSSFRSFNIYNIARQVDQIVFCNFGENTKPGKRGKVNHDGSGNFLIELCTEKLLELQRPQKSS